MYTLSRLEKNTTKAPIHETKYLDQGFVLLWKNKV